MGHTEIKADADQMVRNLYAVMQTPELEQAMKERFRGYSATNPR